MSATATTQPDSVLADGSGDTSSIVGAGVELGGWARQLLIVERGGGRLGDSALLDGAENLADSWQNAAFTSLFQALDNR